MNYHSYASLDMWKKEEFKAKHYFGKIDNALFMHKRIIFLGTPYSIQYSPREKWIVRKIYIASKPNEYTSNNIHIMGMEMSLERVMNSTDMPTELKRAIAFNLNEFKEK